MEINWFTLVAQILNFFLLVWLLKRFLYKPILKAIDERESKIVAQLNYAEAKKAEALKEQEEFKQKNLNFEIEKKELMKTAVSESKETRSQLLEKARADAEDLKNKLEKAAKEKQQNSESALTLKIQEEVFSVSRKALSDLASTSLEEQATLVFIKRLKSLKAEALEQFKNAFKNNEISLKSAFPIPADQQNQINEAVNNLLEKKVILSVDVSSELIGGIELSTKDYKLSWSISGYLKDLEERVFEKTIEEKIAPTAS